MSGSQDETSETACVALVSAGEPPISVWVAERRGEGGKPKPDSESMGRNWERFSPLSLGASCGNLLLIIFLLFILAGSAGAAGIVLTKGSPSEADSLASVYEYARMEPFQNVVHFFLTNGTKRSIVSGKIADSIEYYAPGNVPNLITLEQIAVLEAQADQARRVVARYPQTAKYLKQSLGQLQADISQWQRGARKFEGEWMTEAQLVQIIQDRREKAEATAKAEEEERLNRIRAEEDAKREERKAARERELAETAALAANKSRLSKEIEEIRASVPTEEELEGLRNRFTPLSFMVTRRIDDNEYDVVPQGLKHEGVYWIRDGNAQNILITTETRFESAGRGSLCMQFLEKKELKADDGFIKTVGIFLEIPPDLEAQKNYRLGASQRERLQKLESELRSLEAGRVPSP